MKFRGKQITKERLGWWISIILSKVFGAKVNLENSEVKNEGSNTASVETSNIEETALEGYLKEIDIMDTEFDKSVVLQDAETTLIDIDLQTISEKLTEISEKDISLYLEQAG